MKRLIALLTIVGFGFLLAGCGAPTSETAPVDAGTRVASAPEDSSTAADDDPGDNDDTDWAAGEPAAADDPEAPPPADIEEPPLTPAEEPSPAEPMEAPEDSVPVDADDAPLPVPEDAAVSDDGPASLPDEIPKYVPPAMRPAPPPPLGARPSRYRHGVNPRSLPRGSLPRAPAYRPPHTPAPEVPPLSEPQPGLEPALEEKPDPDPPADTPAGEDRVQLVDKELRSVKVFYGTNRARGVGCETATSASWNNANGRVPNDFYSGKPASGDSSRPTGLEVGTLTVTFPPRRKPGKIPRPLKIFTYELRDEDPEKDVVITELTSFGSDCDAWVNTLQGTGRKQAFVYVHGFAHSFAKAARRTAQVAYDLDFDVDPEFAGLTMMYSWPSLGEASPTAYNVDYDTSDAAVEAFNQFLDLLKEQARIERVHIIAHSMGNRLVARALDARDAPEKIVDQLVLAAPDIWAGTFKSRFLKLLPKFAQRVTLYVSDNDRALILSSQFRQGEPRAGQAAGGLLGLSVKGFEPVNASGLDTDFLGHSYYATNKSMLSDVHEVLRQGRIKDRPTIDKEGPPWRLLSAEEMALIDQHSVMPDERTRGWIWILTVAAGSFAALLVAACIVVRSRRRRL